MSWDYARLILGIIAVIVIVAIVRSAIKGWTWSDRRNYLRSMQRPQPDSRRWIDIFRESEGQ